MALVLLVFQLTGSGLGVGGVVIAEIVPVCCGAVSTAYSLGTFRPGNPF